MSEFSTRHQAEVSVADMNGKEVWTVNAAEEFEAPDTEFGYACSPVCIDGKVIIPMGGPGASMIALDQSDGSLIWKSGVHKISYSSAYPIKFRNRPLVVGYFRNELCVFDQNTGDELVTLDISEDYDEHSAWPIYQEPYLWVSGPFRAGSQLLQLAELGSGLSLKPIYKSELMSNDVASSVLEGGRIYGFDIRDVQSKVHRPSRGQFTCMEFKSGKLVWQNGSLGRRKMDGATISSRTLTSETDIGHASVIIADGKLILLNDTGQLILGTDANDSFAEIGRVTILGGEIGWTAPSLIDGFLFARNQSKAVCVYLGESQSLSKNSESVRYAEEIPQSEYVDWASRILGTEPKYAMTAPKTGWLLNWFLISIAMGWIASPLISIGLTKVVPAISLRTWFLALTFLAGAFGTTIAGHWQQVFYFSWPISLAIVFELVVCQLKNKDSAVKPRPIIARLALLAFLVTCVGYFLLCRRLSLAFEWAFLIGFPFSLPFLWLVKESVQQQKHSFGYQWFWSLLGFAAFFWAGAGLMIWKY